jgi:Peptidase family M23
VGACAGVRRLLAVSAVLLAVAAPAAAARDRRWLRPVEGPVVRHFRWVPGVYTAGWHRGVTFAAAPGARVLAPCAGRVAFVGPVGTSGRVVSLACRRYRATLVHLGALGVRRGVHAPAGSPVGRAGASGRVQLGARAGDRYVDPLKLIATPPRAPLGPAPAPRPSRPSPVAPVRGPALRPRSVEAPRPAAPPRPSLPLAGWWAPAGAALLLAGVAFGAGRALAGRVRPGRASLPSPATARRTARGRPSG